MSHSKLQNLLQDLKRQSRQLRKLTLEQRNFILNKLKHNISIFQSDLLLENQKDIEDFKKNPQWTKALEDRLTLTPARLDSMQKSIDVIVAEPDPLNQIIKHQIRPNGLEMDLVTDAFGVILFIFEARPNVITEAFALALKSGNVMLFKNGKEAHHSAEFLYSLIQKSLVESGFSSQMMAGLSGLSREETTWLLKQDAWIDLVIPRGGDALIHSIKENSRIPTILNDRGLCHLFVDASADVKMALAMAVNAKTQRPGVCNSIETILVHQSLAESFLPTLCETLGALNVDFYVDDKSYDFLQSFFNRQNHDLLSQIHRAQKDSFATEYLDLKLNLKVVQNLSEAIDHINQFGSKHSEVIITGDRAHALHFQDEVDAAVTYWNASSRFTDGFEFGFGGEIGISTQKLHVRGPVGLSALTNQRWKISGTGQIR